jgi:predicted esterase
VIRSGLLVVCTAVAACQTNGAPQTSLASPASSTTITSAELPASGSDSEPGSEAEGSVRIEDVRVPDDLPAVVIRGLRPNGLRMLFLAGMCTHPGGYLQSFQRTAAAHGDLVAVQGDVSCGGEGASRRWSSDLEAMDKRIDAAFVASGLGEPREIVVIGYSQGAERAERLVGRWPEKYSSAVLMASPVRPSRTNLRDAHAAVLMAGTLDAHAQAQSKSAVPSLLRANVPVTFIELPGARHGQMGAEPESSMEEALDFIEARLPHNALDAGRPPSNR